MQIRISTQVRHLTLEPGKAHLFRVGNTNPTRVMLYTSTGVEGFEFETVTLDEEEGFRGVPSSLCTGDIEYSPSESTSEYLANLSALPALDDSEQDGIRGNGVAGVVINHAQPPIEFEVLPEGVQRELRAVTNRISNAVRVVIDLICWRFAIALPVRATGWRWLTWSYDGELWHRGIELPVRSIEFEQFAPPESVVDREMTQMLAGEVIAPLAYELFREARELQYSNPRSSLLVAIAAAEIGCKQCLISLVPEVDWLLSNVPSPRLETLIWQYLPTLQTVFPIDEVQLLPPKKKDGRPTGDLYQALSKGVTIRNGIVHKSATPPKIDTVADVLQSVSDLLRIFDYYSGHEWAFELISEETRVEWAVP